VDLTQGKRAIVGFVSGAHTVADGNQNAAGAIDTNSVISKGRVNKKEDKDRDQDKKDKKNRNHQNTR